MKVIEHPFEPIYDKNSEILILGSFPSVKSREESFYYAHPQNRFWKLISMLYGEKTPISIDEKKKFLYDNKIALWDVLFACDITGSADSAVKNAVPNDISVILKTANIEKIFVNGRCAEHYYKKLIEPKVNRPALFLPSTSAANASFSTERLFGTWKTAFKL